MPDGCRSDCVGDHGTWFGWATSSAPRMTTTPWFVHLARALLPMRSEGDFMHSERPYWLQQMAPILETLNEGVLIADDSDRIFFVNTAFEEMTGSPRDEIIGRDALRLILSAEDYARIQVFRETTRVRGRGREEFFLPTKDGGRLPVVISVRAMTTPEGGDVAIVTLTDISEQKRTEEKLREANARLEGHQREIELDLTLAAGVQQSLAPKAMSWGSLQVDTFYQPWHRIGGDRSEERRVGQECRSRG